MSEAVKYIILSTMFFAAMNTGVKALVGISFVQVVFFRAVISMLLCIAQAKRDHISLTGKDRKWLFLRGAFGTIGLFSYYYCVQKLPLATAVTLQYLSPIFSLLLAFFLLGERPKAWQWIFIFLGFCGVILLKGFDAQVAYLDICIGILGAFTSACAYNVVRKSSGSNHPVVIIFYFPVVTLPIVVPMLPSVWVAPSLFQWALLLFVGVCTHFGQVYLTKAYQLEKVTNLSQWNYLGVVYAVVIGFLLFHESVSLTGLLGIFLIVSTSFLSGSSIFRLR